MTPNEALSYSSSTVLGQEIAAIQQLYASMVASGSPTPLQDKAMGILARLIALNERLIAYESEVADFQTRCTALAKGQGLGGLPVNGRSAGVPPLVIGLGSAGLGGIIGFVAAKALSKPKEEDDEENER
jgi:hypothetical protein